ncbi:MAG TPA: hypothetical protein VFF30_17865 [Nitrososphaerales archaeon]|nr:hypothetical protein [Nitrososphaerales archaeon]
MTEQGFSVTFQKLKAYCDAHGGYDLWEDDDGTVVLSFVPSFPEAQDKGEPDQAPPRVTMRGSLGGMKVTFTSVEVEDSLGIHQKQLEDAKVTYRGWLEYIEENY